MFDISKPQKVSITHPLIHSAYLKQSSGADGCDEDVLVLEAYEENELREFDGSDTYLIDLLHDLQDLKEQAELKFGPIDRLDIRRH